MKKLNYPLFGLVCDSMPDHEENYLYTVDEFKAFNETVYQEMIEKSTRWQEFYNRDPENEYKARVKCDSREYHWNVWLISTDEELKRFLTGGYNDVENVGFYYEDKWYWENVKKNDLCGTDSDTMMRGLEQVGLTADSTVENPFEKFRKLAYNLYVTDWRYTYFNATIEKYMLKKYYADITETGKDESYEDYLHRNGCLDAMYLSYSSFITTKYKDRAYMDKIISNGALYLNDYLRDVTNRRDYLEEKSNSKEYIVLTTNTFDERVANAAGPYTYEEAIKVLKDIYNQIISEWDDDDMYEDATLSKYDEENFEWFTITWDDETYTDYQVILLNKREK